MPITPGKTKLPTPVASGEYEGDDAFVVETRVRFVGGEEIPLEYAAPFALKFTAGTVPYMFQLHISDDSVFPKPGSGDGQKVEFIFSTPSASGGRTDIVFSGWYLVRVEAAKTESGLMLATFADERWKLQHRRFSLYYNLQWPDGSYRYDTVPGGGGRTGSVWTAWDALKDALTKMGYAPNYERLSASKAHIRLPNNLGNSKGGGFVDATFDEIVVPMLEVLDAHLYFIDGQPHITDRTGDIAKSIQKLRAIPRIVDTVGESKNKWERPRKLRVSFEIKAEAAVENFLPSTSTQRPFFDVPENVMPRLTPADRELLEWWDAQGKEEQDTEWSTIQEEAAGAIPRFPAPISTDVDRVIGENWYLPFVMPFVRYSPHGPIEEDPDPATNASEIQKKLWLNAQIRRHWHRTYRITYPTGSLEATVKNFRAMAGMRWGRLTPGGDTISRGAVWSDWCEETTAAVRLQPDPFDTQFGHNHPFDPTRPAPFIASWLAESGNELIFELAPVGTMMLGQEKILPGLYVEVPNYGTWFEMSRDGYLAAQELQATLDEDWKFRAIISGRVVGDVNQMLNAASPLGNINGRTLQIEVPMFPDGSLDSLDLKEHTMTANFGYSKEQLALSSSIALVWPEKLLNQSDIERRSNDMATWWKKRLESTVAGGILIPGVEPIQSKIYPGGDIYETSIVVGDPDPWSVTTQYMVIPAIPGPTLDYEELDGYAAQVVAWE